MNITKERICCFGNGYGDDDGAMVLLVYSNLYVFRINYGLKAYKIRNCWTVRFSISLININLWNFSYVIWLVGCLRHWHCRWLMLRIFISLEICIFPRLQRQRGRFTSLNIACNNENRWKIPGMFCKMMWAYISQFILFFQIYFSLTFCIE